MIQTSLFDLPQQSFHNTIDLKEKELIEANNKAIKQEEKILRFFQADKYKSHTPCEVWIAFGQQWPITSIRRAMTDLTNRGLLLKLREKRKGNWGLNNFCWKLNLEQ